MNLDGLAASWAPRLLSVLRIMSGLLLLQHGTAKLLKIPVIPMFANLSLTSPPGIAGILELVGGVLLILGLFTRSAAFILSGMTAVAYFIACRQGLLPDPERRRARGTLLLRLSLHRRRGPRPVERRRRTSEVSA